MKKLTVEDELVEVAQRALDDQTLEHRIVGLGIAVAYEDGKVGGVILAPGAREKILAAIARLEHRVQRELDADEVATTATPRAKKKRARTDPDR